jgi:hypothetical protein
MTQIVPLVTQPAYVVLDALDELGIFLARIGVVQAQVAPATKFAGDAEVQADRLGMADVQVAIGFLWPGPRERSGGRNRAARRSQGFQQAWQRRIR